MAEEIKGYCLKCKDHREMKDATGEWAANGSPATRGKCPVCDTNMYKRGANHLHDDLPKPDPEELAARRKASAKKKKASKKPVRRSGKLVIVESPSKAKTIGKYLGRGYNVTSSVGHVRDLLKSRLSIDTENNFVPEYRVPNEKRPLVKELKAAAAKAQEIYLATDSDREGEAIAWHVLESAEMEPERVKRVVFNEITKKAILEAFEHPRDIDMDQVNAQQARRILDRLVGYKLSPLLWRKVRGRLSAGRVQSVAVRLVVERERAIDAFDAVEYWHLKAHLSQDKHASLGEKRPYFFGKLHRFEGKEPILGSEAEIQPHVDALENATYTVGKVKLGQRTRKPAAPFTTSTLQQEASRKLSFGTSKTMRIAQQLYEGIDIGGETTGLITYMRTDSVTVSKDAQAATRDFVTTEYGAEYLPDTPPIYKTKSKSAQEAHEAVRPTSVLRVPKAIKDKLSRDQFRLYTLIWSRFVASQMAKAVYDTVSADIYAGDAKVDVTKRPYMFRSSGSTLRFKGFLAVYEETRPADKPEDIESIVPSDLLQGESIDMLKLLPEQHFTQPPPRFSEATLVKALEENGVGRPSTYASIISTVQSRGYVVREERRLYPTEIGGIVNDLLVEYFPDILSVDFTAGMEASLDLIADGNEWVPVIDKFWKDFEKKLAIADEKLPKLDLNKEPEYADGRKCPTCEEGDLVYRDGRYGRFIGCNRFPKCRFTEQVLVKVGVTCAHGGGEMIERKTKRGRVFYGCSNYPECGWTSWKMPIPDPSEDGKHIMVQMSKEEIGPVICGLLMSPEEKKKHEEKLAKNKERAEAKAKGKGKGKAKAKK